MITLGIESTAHTFGVGIVTDKGGILANERDVFTTEEGGMIPVEVAEHHVKVFNEVLQRALKKAKLKIDDIGLIVYSQSPGIGNCLRIGAMTARSLAATHDLPIVGVNHCVAHLEIGKLLTDAKDPVFL